MLSAMRVVRKALRRDAPRHPGCRSEGRWVNVLEEGTGRPLLQVGSAKIDAACIALSRAHPRDQNYGLGVVWPLGARPLLMDIDGRAVRVPPGSYLVTNPKEEAAPSERVDMVGSQVGINQAVLREAREVIGIPKAAGPFDFLQVPRRITPEFRGYLAALVGEAEREGGSEGKWSALTLYGGAWRVLAWLWDHHPCGLKERLRELGYQRPIDERLERAVLFMRENFRQAISVAEVARRSGISAPHLFELFRKQFGSTPHAYLRRIRVDRAERLLAERPPAKSKWADVAREVGLGRAQSLREAIAAVHRTEAGDARS